MMKKQKYILFFTLKLIVVTFALWFIYRKIFLNENLPGMKRSFSYLFSYPDMVCFFFVVLMMFLNWGIESLKWKLLVQTIEETSFSRAFRATLSGVTVSIFTPNRAGEFLGRVFYIDKADKIQGALIAVLGSLSQLLVTLICGSAALLFFISSYKHEKFPDENIFNLFVVLVLLINILSLLFYFSSSAVLSGISKISFLNKFEKYSAVLSLCSPGKLTLVLLLSFIRYAIFSFQFFLLMKIFRVDIHAADAIVLIPLVFLAVAAVPAITPAGIGVREFFALQFIGAVSANTPGIVLSTFSMWIINLAVPAMIGTIFIFGMKLKPAKS